MDHRDIARQFEKYKPYKVNEKNGKIILIDDDEGEVELTLEWAVCETCGGNGTHVNPSIDSHGLSDEDFVEDPDFAESYFSGSYNIPCNECGGRRVVPTSSDERFIKAVQLAWSFALETVKEREMGY